MSSETMQWLNTMTLVGFTEKRGNAWHYRAEDQGAENNHYTGAIPVEDVLRRLFNWEAVEGSVESIAVLDNGDVMHLIDANRKAILRPSGAFGANDPGGILGLFKSGYEIHGYKEWLLDTVSNILDDCLSIGAAVMLRDGAQACVSVEVPENITTPSGVVFRPNLLAATSLDGSLSTTYKRVVTNVVCDNTMALALGEQGQQVKVKHTRYSKAKLLDVRAALELVHTISDEFSAQVEELTNITVTEAQWNTFLDTLEMTRLTDPKSLDPRTGRSLTMAQNKRGAMATLYYTDPRVQPWKDTAWGVVQAVNTFAHHIGGTNGKTGTEISQRNMQRAVEGGVDKMDNDTATLIRSIVTA